MSTPLPITLLTGFLGSGKTTLLSRAMADPRHARSAIIVNELSHVGLDGEMLSAGPGQMVQMTTGCICCSSGGDAVAALAGLRRRIEHYEIGPFERVIIETTGMADPVPVIPALMLDRRISDAFRLTHMVATIDAVRGAVVLDRFEEARRQAGMADILALTKTDLIGDPISAAELADLRERLARLAPAAEIVDVHATSDAAAALLATDRIWGARDNAERWLGMRASTTETGGPVKRAHRHDPRIISVGIEWSGAVDGPALLKALRALLDSRLGRILRVKGIVATTEDAARPLVVHAVDDALSEPVRLDRWPPSASSRRLSRLVLIGEGLVEAELRRHLGIPPVGTVSQVAEVRP